MSEFLYFKPYLKWGLVKKVVIAGAGKADEASHMQDKEVTWFEPDLRSFKIASEKIKSYKTHIIYNLGLWSQSAKLSFYQYSIPESSSFYTLGEERSKWQVVPDTDDITEVQVIRADSLISEADLVILDVQGAELEVLEGFSDIFASNPPLYFLIETMQLPLYEAGPTRNSILEKMSLENYEVVLELNVHKPEIQVTDVLFKRKEK